MVVCICKSKLHLVVEKIMVVQAYHDYATLATQRANAVGEQVKCLAESLSEELKGLNLEDTFAIEGRLLLFLQELEKLRSAQKEAIAAEDAAYA